MIASRPTKVAMIVPSFPNVSETFVVARLRGLLERGWDVHVFCERSSAEDWRSYPELSYESLRKRIHLRRWAPSRAYSLLNFPIALLRSLLASPSRTLRYVLRGSRIYRRSIVRHLVEDTALIAFGPDILHLEFGTLGVNREAVANLLGAALVTSFQGWDVNFVGLEEPDYYRKLFECVDAAHFVSNDLLHRAMRRGLPSDAPAFVVHNGVDVEAFSDRERRHTDVVGISGRPLRLLSVGRLHWKKGYAYALEAVKLLEEAGVRCEYRIVGDGDFREAVAFHVTDLALQERVVLTGSLPSEGVREVMRWADVLVHPAISEGFCLAVTEAQAMGLPVVVSDADGLRENVADKETGFVVPRRDARDIADKIKELARDPELRERMGRAGMERAHREFRVERYIAGIEDVYRSALRHASS